MSVRIRLSRSGSKKRPYYRIVAADQRAPRDGRFIEKLGSYNPLLPQDHEARLVVDKEKVAAWLAKGAQPTERLQKLFANLGLCEAPKIVPQPKKSAPKAKAVERMKEKDDFSRFVIWAKDTMGGHPLIQNWVRQNPYSALGSASGVTPMTRERGRERAKFPPPPTKEGDTDSSGHVGQPMDQPRSVLGRSR